MYDRNFDGEVLDLGAIGIRDGTLIMYDVQTRSWWSQLFGKAISGPMKDKKLVKLPSTMTTWKKWKAVHPDTTAYIKRSIPYHEQSDYSGSYIAEMATKGDGPVEAIDLVVGVEGHEVAKAYLLRYLAKNRVLNEELEGHPIVVMLTEELDTARILDRSVDGKTLTFSLADGDRLQDAETGSLWDPMTGEAVSGALKGKRLKAFVSTYSLWYAWEKYRPDTELIAFPN